MNEVDGAMNEGDVAVNKANIDDFRAGHSLGIELMAHYVVDRLHYMQALNLITAGLDINKPYDAGIEYGAMCFVWHCIGYEVGVGKLGRFHSVPETYIQLYWVGHREGINAMRGARTEHDIEFVRNFFSGGDETTPPGGNRAGGATRAGRGSGRSKKGAK